MNLTDTPRPRLLLLFGPPAVGKTTVGQVLEQRTGFRPFHIHQVIDLVTQYFLYSTLPTSPYVRLVTTYRTRFIEEEARSGLSVITTLGWWLDVPEEVEVIRGYVQPFLEHDGQVSFVELVASLEARLARNDTENRQRLKRVDWSTEEYLRCNAGLNRYDSGGVLPFNLPLLRVETDELSAEATAECIIRSFNLPRVPA